MLNNGLLFNKPYCSFRYVLFDCSSCKLGKSNILPFPTHNDIVIVCFDLIHMNVWGIGHAIAHSQVLCHI